MIKGVLCSTGALITRFNGRDARLLPGFAPHIECDGFEVMLYSVWQDGGKTREYVDFLSRCGLPFPVIHADKSIGELLSVGGEENAAEARRRFGINCAAGEKLGCSLMVLHLWGGPASDYELERNIAELERFTAEASEHGIELTVENVISAKNSPLDNLKTVLDRCPGTRFTIDTKMAEFHRELQRTLEYEPLWAGGLAAHLHINDYGGGYRDFADLRVLHPGDGHVDFESVFKKVRESGYNGWATCEATSVRPDGSIDFEKLNRSLRRIREGLE